MSKSIGIIGAGWLGGPLAKTLMDQNHKVYVTCTSEEKKSELNGQFSHIETFTLGRASLSSTFSEQCRYVVLNIPFSKCSMTAEQFVRHMKKLCSSVLQDKANRLIFVSTTSVYGQSEGVINELSPATPETPSAVAHHTIEQALWENYSDQITILRLSGLVGGKRHPIHQLQHKKTLSNSNWPVNLVHRSDVINACLKILEQDKWSQRLILSSLIQPTKAEYYQWAAEKLGVPCPTMKSNEANCGKRIDASWSWRKLDLQPTYASPYDML